YAFIGLIARTQRYLPNNPNAQQQHIAASGQTSCGLKTLAIALNYFTVTIYSFVFYYFNYL
ncbi:hypothetical protein ACOW8K_004212, partial [Vibrio parahaemolyticus]